MDCRRLTSQLRCVSPFGDKEVRSVKPLWLWLDYELVGLPHAKPMEPLSVATTMRRSAVVLGKSRHGHLADLVYFLLDIRHLLELLPLGAVEDLQSGGVAKPLAGVHITGVMETTHGSACAAKEAHRQ